MSKTCLLPQVKGHMGVKFYENAVIQKVFMLECWFWFQMMQNCNVSISHNSNIYAILTRFWVILEKLIFQLFRVYGWILNAYYFSSFQLLKFKPTTFCSRIFLTHKFRGGVMDEVSVNTIMSPYAISTLILTQQ